jgi:hypothetical protein
MTCATAQPRVKQAKKKLSCLKRLHQVASKISAGRPGSFAGWVIDNTRANMAAVNILDSTQPSWINLGCVAHGTHSAMKDFAEHKKTRGRYASEFGVQWIQDVVKDCCSIANYIQDSGPAKTLLHSHQTSIYGVKRAVPINVPTRFATSFFVMNGIMNSKAAFIQAASSDAWSELGGKSSEVCIWFFLCSCLKTFVNLYSQMSLCFNVICFQTILKTNNFYALFAQLSTYTQRT